jgi:hypothetical protein
MKKKQSSQDQAPGRSKKEPTQYVGMRMKVSFAKRLEALAQLMGDAGKRSVVEMLENKSLRDVEKMFGIESPPLNSGGNGKKATGA